ncbi:mannose-1-phosphate guanylyltransferase/mannose-6-phosphate isomerase [bacterium]|nr:MAG: mannose-1-phosphate guanylyltransferase/mannose-6-phosphate isomerase [bacterium]
MNYVIILAGGVGSRFWPLSRELEPKQFLNICSKKPMLDECLSRIKGLFPKENIFIATNKAHRKKLNACLKRYNLPNKNIFLEPEGKNTLAPIAFLSKKINESDPDASILVLPCDHFVRDKRKFLKLLKKGLEVSKQGQIVTFGFPPKRPETGYGYIKVKSKKKDFYSIEKFLEKPDLARAKELIKDKHYYWNGGLFIFKPSVMLGEVKKFKPEAYKALQIKKNFKRLWRSLPSISVDYAVMEKTKKAVLMVADYGWLDLGSWQSMEEILKKDKSGNIFKGNCLDLGSKNTLVWSEGQLVATLGLKNMVIVATKDAILAAAKDKTQEVKKIVQILRNKKSGK